MRRLDTECNACSVSNHCYDYEWCYITNIFLDGLAETCLVIQNKCKYFPLETSSDWTLIILLLSYDGSVKVSVYLSFCPIGKIILSWLNLIQKKMLVICGMFFSFRLPNDNFQPFIRWLKAFSCWVIIRWVWGFFRRKYHYCCEYNLVQEKCCVR